MGEINSKFSFKKIRDEPFSVDFEAISETNFEDEQKCLLDYLKPFGAFLLLIKSNHDKVFGFFINSNLEKKY